MSEEILCHLPVSTFVIFQIEYLQIRVSTIWKMLSFDQCHFTFHNLTEQRYVCNYFSGDGAKEGISPFTRVVSRLKIGRRSAITFLVQVHINILRGILWLHAFRKIYEQADIESLGWGNLSWKSLIYSYWNRGQVVWFFGRNTSTVKSRKESSHTKTARSIN